MTSSEKTKLKTGSAAKPELQHREVKENVGGQSDSLHRVIFFLKKPQNQSESDSNTMSVFTGQHVSCPRTSPTPRAGERRRVEPLIRQNGGNEKKRQDVVKK